MSTLVNSEDPDEVCHNAAFHQGFSLLAKIKRISTILYGKYNL